MFHPEYINPKKLINNDDILYLFKLVEKHGGVLRFVGGAVRDAIAGINRTDIDMVTDLSPAEFSEMCDDEGLRCVPIGIQFFTTGVIVNSSFFKVTSLTGEEDNAKDEWKNDAAKRDLTINAVYADDKGNVFDYYNGIDDLEKGVIKFIGNPQKNIEYDNIRIMRFFRFCAMFGKNIDKKSLNACIKNKDLLHQISTEKIKEELFKIFMAPYAVETLDLIFQNGILDFMLAPPKNSANLRKLSSLVENLNIEKSIIRRLFVAFLPDYKRANRLAEIFKLSKDEKDRLIDLTKIKFNPKQFKNTVSINKLLYLYGKETSCDIWICNNLDNSNYDEVKSVLNTLITSSLPTFPLNGKDLINEGTDTRLVGMYIDILKKEWFESGCTFTKKDLLSKFNEVF